MKPEEKYSDETVDKALGLFREPPVERMESARDRVASRFDSFQDYQDKHSQLNLVPAVRKVRWPAFAAIAAAMAIAILVPATALRSAPAVLEDGSGSRTVRFGEVVKPNGSRGGTLLLSDGTRVEMRATAELRLERANDGVKVRLERGDFIIEAASNAAVETKDASAVGKTFLVNAQEQGSRIAALVGEARVQQGTTETTLLPGEQVSTNPRMESVPVREALGWSARVETRVAQWTLAALREPAPREEFEVASVKPSAGGARGASGPMAYPCNGGGPRVDPGRFSVTYLSVYRLIAWGYGKDCGSAQRFELLTGGPGWVRSDPYAIEAVIPAGTPSYTQQQVVRAAAPKVQKMLQALLAERFKLVIRTEMKETPVYNFVQGKTTGRLKLSEDQTPIDPAAPLTPSSRGTFQLSTDRATGVVTLSANAVPLETLWEMWWRTMVDRPVVDKVDLKVLYDIPQFQFTMDAAMGRDGKSQLDQIFDQLGLKLEPARAQVEVLIIDHIERPTEN